MDIYDYNEENLSMIAGNCRYMNYRPIQGSPGYASGVSCRECKSWTGSGCKRQQLDNIASDLQLD